MKSSRIDLTLKSSSTFSYAQFTVSSRTHSVKWTAKLSVRNKALSSQALDSTSSTEHSISSSLSSSLDSSSSLLDSSSSLLNSTSTTEHSIYSNLVSAISSLFKIIKMSETKIRFFKELKNEREDSIEYLENIEWVYIQNFSFNKSTVAAMIEVYRFKTYHILFRQNLKFKTHDWYQELDLKIKNNWNELIKKFLINYKVILKNAQIKKFELRVQLTNLMKKNTENIFEYLDKACYDSSYAPSLMTMLMTMLMTILRTIVDRSSLEHRLVSKSTLFRVSLCSSESYK